MSVFIDRTPELSTLKSEYDKKGAGLIVIYGRRRVGKTTLIREFLKNKPHIYFLADKQFETELIGRLRNSISEYLKDPNLAEIEFKTWDSLFDYWIKHADCSNKVVFVIDEFQYLASVNNAFPTIISFLMSAMKKSYNCTVL